MQLNFGHSAATLTFWRKVVRRALATGTPTPFYLCSSEPIRKALAELDALDCGLPTRQWLSCKSQPVAQLLRWWLKEGRPIEIVSEFEFLAALHEGFKPEQILINGPAKHRWLSRYRYRGLRVNFDSRGEFDTLLPLARKLNWSLGIRCNTREEHDPDKPDQPTQFGFEFEEAVSALRELRRNRARIETVHFHLRSNIESHEVYERAIVEVADICRKAKCNPLHLDIGGGVPQSHVLTPEGRDYASHFDLESFAGVLRQNVKQFPSLRELWFENGRFLCARCGVLVLKIIEIKNRRGLRQLICDGGRTLNALVSDWEHHELIPATERPGKSAFTAVHGPTCMAFDSLTRCKLPNGLRLGDHLIWLDSGAYHLPWETHFSHGLATVLWEEEGKLKVARKSESFDDWWGRWE